MFTGSDLGSPVCGCVHAMCVVLLFAVCIGVGGVDRKGLRVGAYPNAIVKTMLTRTRVLHRVQLLGLPQNVFS